MKRRMIPGRFALALVAGVMLAATVTPAALANHNGETLTLTPNEGAPGISVQAQGTGMAPSQPYQIRWGQPTGPTVASGTTLKNGTFSNSFQVPTNATRGVSYDVYACIENPNIKCDNYNQNHSGAKASFFVTPAPTTTTGGPGTTAAPTTTTRRGTSSTTSSSTTSTTVAGPPPAPPSFVGFTPGAGLIGEGVLGGPATVLPIGGEAPAEGFRPRCEAPSQATVLDFDDVAPGTDIRERYSDLGAHLTGGTGVPVGAFTAIDRPLVTEDATSYGSISAANVVALPNDATAPRANEAIHVRFDTPQRLIGVHVGETADLRAEIRMVIPGRERNTYPDPNMDVVSFQGPAAVTNCMLIVLPASAPASEVVIRTSYVDSDLRIDRLFFSDDPSYRLPEVVEGYVVIANPRDGTEVDVTGPYTITGGASPGVRPGDTADRRVERVRVTYPNGTGGWVSREAEVIPSTAPSTHVTWRLEGVTLPEGPFRVSAFASGRGMVASSVSNAIGFTQETRRREAQGTFDLQPMGFEVTQGMRSVLLPMSPGGEATERPTHVAGRATTVRAFGRLVWGEGGAPRDVDSIPTDAWLFGFSRGRLLPGSPLRASPSLVDLVERAAPLRDMNAMRLERDASWNFALPLAWSAEGSLDLFLWINPPGEGSWREGGPNAGRNHLRLNRVRFAAVDPRDVILYLADFHWRRGGPVQHARPTLGELGRALDYWERVFPLPYGGLRVTDARVKRWAQRACLAGEEPVADFCSTAEVPDVPLWDNAIIVAEQAEAMARGHQVFIPLLFSPASPIGCSGRAGIGRPPLFHAGACGPTIAQEAAHSLGLNHWSNAHGENAGGGYTDRFAGDHGEIRTATVGWDIGTGQPVLPTVGDSHRHDFMSYGWSDSSNAWISAETWQRVANAMRSANPISSTTGVPFRVAAGSEFPAPSLVVSGTIRRTAGSSKDTLGLRRLIRVEVEAPASSGDDARIVLVDAAGKDRLSHGFALPDQTHDDTSAEFHVVVPLVEGARTVELRRAGVKVASMPVSKAEPLADVEGPGGPDALALIRSPGGDGFVPLGGSARFDAFAAGLKGPVEYRWTLDGQPLEGAQTVFVAGLKAGAHRLGLEVIGADGTKETAERNVLFDADKDGDGLGDRWEKAHGLSPTDASDASADRDGDGLVAWAEQAAGSDPRERDSDGDRYEDQIEVAGGSDPADRKSVPQALHTRLGQVVPTSAQSGSSSGWVLPVLASAVVVALAGVVVVRRRKRLSATVDQ